MFDILISKECKLSKGKVCVFAKKEYLQHKGQDYGYIYGMIDAQPVFYLAFVLKQRWFFCLAEFQTSVICLDSNYRNFAEVFLEEAVQRLARYKTIDFICQNPAYAIFDVFPKNAKYTYFGSYVCSLEDSEDVLWKKVHSKHRNVIRKAKNNGVEILFNEFPIEEIYEMISLTQARSGNGFVTQDAFCSLIEGLEGNIDLVSAHYKGEMQGCAVLAHDCQRVYYLFGGSCSKPFPGALNLLHWEAMMHYKSLGILEYDFVGARLSGKISSKLQGIQRFKSRFGGELNKGFLWKYIFRKEKYFLYKILCFVKNHKWDVDAIDEEHITNI